MDIVAQSIENAYVVMLETERGVCHIVYKTNTFKAAEDFLLKTYDYFNRPGTGTILEYVIIDGEETLSQTYSYKHKEQIAKY